MSRLNLLIVGTLLVLVFIFYIGLETTKSTDPNWSLVPTIKTFFSEEEHIEDVLFVGDVMLARDVEARMRNLGLSYPFIHLIDFFGDYDYVVGNFEGGVPSEHRPTPSMGFQFSVPKEHLAILKEVGFTHFSLANNHSKDFGNSGYKNTITELRRHDLEVFGEPYVFSTSTSVTVVDLEDRKLGLIGIDLTLQQFSDAEIKAVIDYVESLSDWQIVFVHWGEEYQLTHSVSQQRYAELFIDEGADMVIGHHPHVIQDVGLYQDKLIFYSLGNFIFDQYFSFDVQHGLALGLEFEESFSVKLIPVSTLGSKAAPQVMVGDARQVILDNLAKNSDVNLREYIAQGLIILDDNLAVSTQID